MKKFVVFARSNLCHLSYFDTELECIAYINNLSALFNINPSVMGYELSSCPFI